MEPITNDKPLGQDTKETFPTLHPLVYVGTNAEGGIEGVFLYRLNSTTGELTCLSSIKAGERPSYLNLDGSLRYLYSVNKDEGGTLQGFSIHQKTGELTLINKQPSPGGATHVSVDHTDKVVLVANYQGGTVGLYPILENGKLGPAGDTKQHKGSSVNKARQEGPHAHFITADPSNHFALVMDLGLDKIIKYRLDLENNKLIDEPNAAFESKPGAGPRHMAFHPNKRFAYVINELDSSITALHYDAETGKLTGIQTVNTLPSGWEGQNLCAAIHVSPNGKYVYGSNRGHDSIVVFKVDQDTGKLEFVEHTTGVNEPRDFVIDLAGKILLAGYQNSDKIVTYHIDSETGKLTPTGHEVKVTTPVCLKVVPDFTL